MVIHGRRSAGFTLVELLVVVSIIALLMAILLPSLSKSRKQARAAVCGSHLHQLGIAAQMYLTENGCYPPHKDSTLSNAVRWPTMLAAYVRSEEFLICPSVSDWKVGRNNAYGYNYKYLGCMRTNRFSPTAPFERFPVKQVHSPGMTIAHADSDGTGWEKPYDPEGRDPQEIGNHGYTLDPTFAPMLSLSTADPQGNQEAYSFRNTRTYISTRHHGASNAVFVDGHVERITPRLVYRDNRHWNGLGREDPVFDPHVTTRVDSGTFRYESHLR